MYIKYNFFYIKNIKKKNKNRYKYYILFSKKLI